MSVEERLARVEERLASVEDRLNHLSNKVDSLLIAQHKTLRRVIYLILAILASILGVRLAPF